MSKKLYKVIEIKDLKDMLNKTKKIYEDRPAYKIKIAEGKYKIISHLEVRNMIDNLGTALINMGLKDKRIAVIGENRYEWEIAYLSIVCGTGIVVPLDKSLPENELEMLIKRSDVEAIFYSKKYEEKLEEIREKKDNNLKYLISMDNTSKKNILSQDELITLGKKMIDDGNKEFINAEIDNEKMSMMLFTSGTTSVSKVVALSHKNICSNLMDIASVLDVTEEDTLLSILPIHHVFECTVGFLFALYKGAQTAFCDGIRHIVENLNEYKITVMACVPGVYERIFMMIRKQIEKEGKLEEIIEKENKLKNATMEEKKKEFKEIHNLLGGKIKLFISGAASLEPSIEEKYNNLGINLVQGYGLTETSPVVAVGTNKEHKVGSVGKTVPNVQAKLININSEGIGELVVKGLSIAEGYYNDEKNTKESFKNGWFYTGDLAKIDDEGYIFICGRKKSVIVLKNGKNIFPEEIESLINNLDGVNESLIYGKQITEDKENIKINAIIVIDKQHFKNTYKVKNTKEIYNIIHDQIKKINETIPKYKAIRGITITEKPLIRTTTNKIKRQANLDAIK